MMQAIKGVTVKLIIPIQKDTDTFNAPICDAVSEYIDNVLIGEPTSEEVINEMNLSGKRIAYTLAIPKGDDHMWEDAIVEFYGMKFRTIGAPTQGIDENIPLSWNKKVKVERYVTED